MIDEDELLTIAITNIRKVLNFDPYKSYSDISNRDEFKQLISNDPAFGLLGLDDDRYIIARVGGNLINSLHRKLGDMYEGLFVYLLTKSFSLDENELNFSVEVKIGERNQIRSTDGLIPNNKFNDWTLDKKSLLAYILR